MFTAKQLRFYTNVSRFSQYNRWYMVVCHIVVHHTSPTGSSSPWVDMVSDKALAVPPRSAYLASWCLYWGFDVEQSLEKDQYVP